MRHLPPRSFLLTGALFNPDSLPALRHASPHLPRPVDRFLYLRQVA